MIFKNYDNKRISRFPSAIIGHLFNVIYGHFFRGIRRLLFRVICGLRPANLDCQIASGNDYRVKKVTSGNDYRVVQSGRSMIEMLGVLAIIAVLSVGGIAGYSKAMTKFKVNKTIDMITSAIVNTKTAFAHEKYYSALYDGVADNLNLLPKNRKTPLGSSINMWPWCDEEVSIDEADNNRIHKSFAIDVDRVSKEACLNLLSYDWSQAGVTVIQAGYLGDSEYGGEDFFGYLAVTPIAPADISEMCSKFDLFIYNYIDFYIGTKPVSECFLSYLDTRPETTPINFDPYY